MTARFPRYGSRFASRCLALVLALVLAVGPVASVQAQSYGGEYYRGGNATFGDFGGYGFFPDDQYGGRLIEGQLGAGAEIDLGCGALNIMDYMRATFNVNNLIERAKASMQTMVAKYVMVFLLSQPIIASAMDKLNGMLNFGYDLFNQSCSLDEVQQLAKARYTRNCIEEGNHPVDCQEMSDPLKPLMNQASAVLGEDLERVISDPVGSLQATMGCNPGATYRRSVWENDAGGGDTIDVAQSDACILMSFAPRVCGNVRFGLSSSARGGAGDGFGGCSSSQAPISGAGIVGFAVRGTAAVINKVSSVWDGVRQANPRSTVADLKIISSRSVVMANEDAHRNASIPTPMSPRTQLAMTNITYVSKMFGAGGSEASEGMLNEYRNSDVGLKGCSPANRTDPLRMVRFVAKAANEHFGNMGGVTIDENIAFTEDEKLKAEDFFNFKDIPEAVQKNMGIDAKSAMTMLEETFSCLANGQAGLDQGTPLTNPEIGWRVATGTPLKVGQELQVLDWQTTSQWMGRPISCKSVNKVFSFLITKFKAAKSQLDREVATDGDIALNPTTIVANDGTETVKPGKKMKARESKDILSPALDQVITQFQTTLDANDRACIGFTSTGVGLQ